MRRAAVTAAAALAALGVGVWISATSTPAPADRFVPAARLQIEVSGGWKTWESVPCGRVPHKPCAPPAVLVGAGY